MFGAYYLFERWWWSSTARPSSPLADLYATLWFPVQASFDAQSVLGMHQHHPKEYTFLYVFHSQTSADKSISSRSPFFWWWSQQAARQSVVPALSCAFGLLPDSPFSLLLPHGFIPIIPYLSPFIQEGIEKDVHAWWTPLQHSAFRAVLRSNLRTNRAPFFHERAQTFIKFQVTTSSKNEVFLHF